jgi:hypothetical protein
MEVVMATRNVSKQSSALAKARERRRELDKARDEQDQRIEEATASALVALEALAEAEQVVEAETGKVGQTLKLLLAQDVSAEKAAKLLELDAGEIRRLVKAASAETTTLEDPKVKAVKPQNRLPQSEPKPAETDESEAGVEGAARRAS